jgi:hypothetical protein
MSNGAPNFPGHLNHLNHLSLSWNPLATLVPVVIASIDQCSVPLPPPPRTPSCPRPAPGPGTDAARMRARCRAKAPPGRVGEAASWFLAGSPAAGRRRGPGWLLGRAGARSAFHFMSVCLPLHTSRTNLFPTTAHYVQNSVARRLAS